jgi:hypothetical protein
MMQIVLDENVKSLVSFQMDEKKCCPAAELMEYLVSSNIFLRRHRRSGKISLSVCRVK